MKKLVLFGAALGWAGASVAALPALADEPIPVPPPPAAGAAPAAPASNAMTNPTMAGPLAANPNPAKFEAGSFGPVYVTGVLSGLAMYSDNNFATDHSTNFDVSNAQAIVQKTDGPLQFFVQAGLYSIPALGTPYIRATNANNTFFGPLAAAWGKWAVTDSFSIQAGKLPTLIGAESTFTFQNMNIERGLLWNQENAVNKGIQLNYTAGPVAYSLSLNDGFDSDRYNWLWGSAAWTIDPSNTLSVIAGGNFGTTAINTLLTPLPQSNSTIVNLIYTYNAAPWTVTPYFQFTNVPSNAHLGFGHDASTYGAALLVNYSVNDNWNIAGRGEFIGSTGSVANGAPNLLYGPGSSAWSFTLTPTYQQGIFFVRGEGSIVSAGGTTPGLVFGKTGNEKTQGRVMLETGFVF